MIKFSPANFKLRRLEDRTGKFVFSFDLLSGHTCLFARDCLARVVESAEGRRIVDGAHTLFRCFSASQEVLFRAVYDLRKRNTDEILSAAADSPGRAAQLLADAIPRRCRIARYHVGGDFATKNYFEAWLLFALEHPKVLCYGYSKAIPFFAGADLPRNFRVTASRGGRADHMIDRHNLREAVVVHSIAEARRLRLPIDHDDSHAAFPRGSFALLVHGTQPAGSAAGRAVRELNGVGSYGLKSAGVAGR